MKHLSAQLFFLITFLLSPLNLLAGPGTGLCIDSRGNVYFSDFEEVVKIDPQGRISRFVTNHPSHELALDAKDNLYGRDNHFDNRTGTYTPAYWRATPDGHVSTVTREEGDRVFDAHDAEGNRYALHTSNRRNWIERVSPDGKRVLLAGGTEGYADGHGGEARFQLIFHPATGPDGALYVSSGSRIRKITLDGQVTTVAGPDRDWETTRHTRLMAFALTPSGDLLVTHPTENKIYRIDPSGRVETFLETGSWTPTAVAIRDGAVFVLEYGRINAIGGTRVRRIDPDGRITTLGNTKDIERS